MNGKGMRLVWIVAITTLLAISTAAAQTVTIDVPSAVQNGTQFTVTVKVDQVTNLAGFDLFIKYNTSILQFDSAQLGADVSNFGLNNVGSPNVGQGVVEVFAVTSSPQTQSVTGNNVEVLKLTLTVLKEGQSGLGFVAGSKLQQFDTNTNQIVDYAGVTFQNATVTVQAQVAPAPAPASLLCDYLDKSVVFTSSNTEVTIANVECINESNGVLRFTYSEGSDLIVKFTYPTDGYAEITITSDTGTVKNLPADVRQSRDGQFEIPMKTLGSGTYSIRVDVYDRNGNLVDTVDTANTATFSSVGIEGSGVKLAYKAYSINLYSVPSTPKISINAQPSSVVKGDRIYFQVSVSNTPANYRVYCFIEGPYQGIYDQFAGYPKYINQDSFTVSLDTGEFVKNYGAETGMYQFVVYVIDWSTNTTVAVNHVTWELKSISIDVVQPTDSRIGQKIQISGTTNVAETGSEYDAGTPNYAYIEFYHLEKVSSTKVEYRLTLLDPKATASQYAACANLPDDQKVNASICPYWYLWKMQVPIKGGKWEVPSPLYLFPSWETGSYKIEVTVVTSKTYNISDSTTYYFTVSEPKISFNMKTSYVRGESLTFTGKSDIENALSEFNFELVRYLPLQTWIFISPVGDSNDANVW